MCHLGMAHSVLPSKYSTHLADFSVSTEVAWPPTHHLDKATSFKIPVFNRQSQTWSNCLFFSRKKSSCARLQRQHEWIWLLQKVHHFIEKTQNNWIKNNQKTWPSQSIWVLIPVPYPPPTLPCQPTSSTQLLWVAAIISGSVASQKEHQHSIKFGEEKEAGLKKIYSVQ